jgi:RNA 3'-terminal phosphate cyclase (ATP)
MQQLLSLDGSHGEGGGQILRTALSLSMITERPIRIDRIRANRSQPGLAPQHLSACRAAQSLSAARLSGDELGSAELSFAPTRAVKPGLYAFDVAEVAETGSAGAVTLLLQTLLLPLALSDGDSSILLRGGTHVEWAPPFDFIKEVYLPVLRDAGVDAEATLHRWGWYPVGGGEIACTIRAFGHRVGDLRPMNMLQRGSLVRITGRAIAANLRASIAQRMADRVRSVLMDLGAPVDVRAQRVRAASAGAGVFLTSRYESGCAGFAAIGRPGKASELVAEEAAAALRSHHDSGAAVDPHLADQLLLPATFGGGPSTFSIAALTPHFLTNAWVIEQFGLATVTTQEAVPIRVRVEPRV